MTGRPDDEGRSRGGDSTATATGTDSVHLYPVGQRHPNRGHVLLVLTDGPADTRAAAVAGARALEAGVLLFVTAAVPAPGFSLNALLHRARGRRLALDAAAVTGRVVPTLQALGVGHFVDVATVPLRASPRHELPAAHVRKLAHKVDAAQVVTTVPIAYPLRELTPSGPE